MNRINIPAFTSSGMETRRVPTRLRMLGIALMLLNGLRTFNIRKGFKFKFKETTSTILKNLYELKFTLKLL